MTRRERRQARAAAKAATTWLDRAISFVSPTWGLRRTAARQAAAFVSYRGAEHNRLRTSWLAASTSADEALLPEVQTLRDRSRELVRNDAYAAGAVGSVSCQVIGSGIRPQSWVDRDAVNADKATVDDWQRATERTWRKWRRWADSQDRATIEQLQDTVERAILESGDVFVLPVRLKEPYRPYNLALEVVEADRVATPADKVGDSKIRDGVELGSRGQPVAYWVRKQHPGDITLGSSWDNSSSGYVRIPARNRFGQRNVFHLYHQLRPGQTRGTPFFAPVLTLFRDLGEYRESEAVAARVAACFAAFVRRQDPLAHMNAAETNSEGQRIDHLEPGIVEVLGPGEDVQTVNPTRPNAGYAAFVSAGLRAIASGIGMSYEALAKDWSSTTYSSARAAMIEARRFLRRRQALHIDGWLNPTRELLIEEAYLKGEYMDIPASEVLENWDAWSRARWIPEGQGWVDPVKEVQSSEKAILAGLSTAAEECAAQGRDWEEVLEQRSREVARAEELGLPPTPPPAPGTPVESSESSPSVGNEVDAEDLREAVREATK